MIADLFFLFCGIAFWWVSDFSHDAWLKTADKKSGGGWGGLALLSALVSATCFAVSLGGSPWRKVTHGVEWLCLMMVFLGASRLRFERDEARRHVQWLRRVTGLYDKIAKENPALLFVPADDEAMELRVKGNAFRAIVRLHRATEPKESPK